jgi:hypothetical protein
VIKKAIFLFDYTGIMAKPWADAGYICYCFDGQHPQGVTPGTHENILNVGMWFSNNCTGDNLSIDRDHITTVAGKDIDFIFGFPECTDLAVSGAAHFERKRDNNPYFQDEAMMLFYLVESLGDELGCKWALENPVSVAATLWRKPDHYFHPYEYGGYLPEDDKHPLYPEYIKPQDAYPKKTGIWLGNGFVMPGKIPVVVEPGFSDQHKKLGGKSLKTKNIRSATPRGFAQATFISNAA